MVPGMQNEDRDQVDRSDGWMHVGGTSKKRAMPSRVNLSILGSESGKLEQNRSSSTPERHSSILRTASMCRRCLALSTEVSTNTATKVIAAGIKIAVMRPTSGTSVMNNATIAPINNGTIEIKAAQPIVCRNAMSLHF